MLIHKLFDSKHEELTVMFFEIVSFPETFMLVPVDIETKFADPTRIIKAMITVPNHIK